MITQYDPNISWARHTIELTFMQWDYSLKVQVEILGNTKGSSLLDSAIYRYHDTLMEEASEDGLSILRLRRAGPGPEYADDILEITVDDEECLEDICVSAVIVKHEAEERK